MHASAGPPAGPGEMGRRNPSVEAVQRAAVEARLGPLTPGAMEAIRTCRGQEFQRLELIGDSILEVVLHAHSVITGPGCRYCDGRADKFTTDAHLGEIAREIDLGDWLDWTPSQHRMADMVEACVGAAWVSGRWPQVVSFIAAELHPLSSDEQRMLLHGAAQVHPEAPARAREILGAAILEAAASTSAYRVHPEADEGGLSKVKARMLSSEHVLGRARESRWVRRNLRTGHFVRDDVERQLSTNLLAHGLASAITIAWPLVT